MDVSFNGLCGGMPLCVCSDAEVLPWSFLGLPSLVSIAEAVFLLEHGKTDKQIDATNPMPAAGVG